MRKISLLKHYSPKSFGSKQTLLATKTTTLFLHEVRAQLRVIDTTHNNRWHFLYRPRFVQVLDDNPGFELLPESNRLLR